MLNTNIILLITLSVCNGSHNLQCTYPLPVIPSDWIHMSTECVQALLAQITLEMQASARFLAMAAFFSRDDINRPCFADFFYDYADEERGHGIILAEYLVERGELTTGVSSLFQLDFIPPTVQWSSVVSALDDGIQIESNLTDHIRSVIDVCEHANDFEDYALDDWLTAAFLKTQYHNQFELADMISSLLKMQAQHPNLGEYWADLALCDRGSD